jgi:hypothetical protein
MPSTLALTTPLVAAPSALPEPLEARVASYAGAADWAVVERIADADPAALVDRICEWVADRSALPVPAVREVVENLVHADFRDALVSVLDGGLAVRVSDHGPGIDDPVRAMLPGFTSAGAHERRLVRGVGGGLPLARALMEASGGEVEIAPNLGGGAAVTLRLPGPAPDAAPAPGAEASFVPSELARTILALMLEIGEADPGRLAEELGRERAECGRELALLLHRGLVSRAPDGARRLTDAGTALVATLF